MASFIRVICIGKLKERHYKEAAEEYLGRLPRYGRVEVIEFREQTDKSPEVAMRKEAELIIGKLRHGSSVVALDAHGKPASSEEFSQLLRKPDITFIIGGPVGLHQSVFDRSDQILSLSKMTFTHQMARVILLEQIYRGFTILNNERYHK